MSKKLFFHSKEPRAASACFPSSVTNAIVLLIPFVEWFETCLAHHRFERNLPLGSLRSFNSSYMNESSKPAAAASLAVAA